MDIKQNILDAVNEWLTPTFDKATQEAIIELMTTSPKELEESFYKNLEFGKKYGVLIGSGVLKDKLARSVFIADENGLIVYTQVVPEIVDEVNYDECMEAIKKAIEPKPHDPHHNHENWMRH